VGWRATAEVYEHSRHGGGKLHVMLAIAEKASNDDGVAFGIDQGWPRGETNLRRKRETIAGKARLDPATVSRAIRDLVADDELEVRWVRRGQAKWAVYRLIVGDFRHRHVDVDHLERHGQHLDRPFSTPEELLLPVAERGGIDLLEPTEVPDVSSGTSGGAGDADHLAFDQVAPDEKSGSHLTRDQVGPISTRARGSRTTVQQQVHKPSRSEGLEGGQESAAAEPEVTRAEVDEIVRGLRGADSSSTRTVYPLATSLPPAVFRDVVATTRERCRSGTVANPCGLLVSLLKAKHAEQLAQATAAFVAATSERARAYTPGPGHSDQLVRWAPERYVRLLAPHTDDGALRARLEVDHSDKLDALLELAADVRAGRVPPAEPETPEQARARWVDDQAADPEFPLEELAAVVTSWDGVDELERQEHLERAEQRRAAAIATKQAA